MIDLNAIANAPSEANCGICNGRGFYGVPGQRCRFCDGTGRVKWRTRPVEDQPLTTTPVVDQKPADVTDNRAAMRQAIEALEGLLSGTDKTVGDCRKGREAIAALRSALGVDLPVGGKR